MSVGDALESLPLVGWLRRHFGGRTFVMLAAAYIHVVIGIGAFYEVTAPAPGVFHLVMPSEVRGTIWLAGGVIAVVCAWSRTLSPYGIAVLFFMPTVLAISYASGWVISVIPNGSPGYPIGWYSSAFCIGVALLAAAAALIQPKSPGGASTTTPGAKREH